MEPTKKPTPTNPAAEAKARREARRAELERQLELMKTSPTKIVYRTRRW